MSSFYLDKFAGYYLEKDINRNGNDDKDMINIDMIQIKIRI